MLCVKREDAVASLAKELQRVRRLAGATYRQMAARIRDRSVSGRCPRKGLEKAFLSSLRVSRRILNKLVLILRRIFDLSGETETGDALTVSQTVGSHRSRAPGYTRNTPSMALFREFALI
jgi:hypothetical protein